MRKSGRHFWAIWGNFGPFGVIFGPFWVIFGHFWAIAWYFWKTLRKVQFFCGIVGVQILAFRMYDLGSFDFKRYVTIHTGWFGLIYQLSGLWSFAAVICLCVKDAEASSDSLRGFCRSSSCELELQHVGLDTQWPQTREPTANYLYLEYNSI